ncbi:threonine synthase [Fusibacter tunisiensis]|uniref:Threonine synthase n=1 Tax=Fusibacter tunisiensis TaxID=1008308 RepID=A0ABS2MQS2_9FIRM|nr:threonine synthase [Fusibacter tunisiensis]MBM7561725.1 threonine synthase [Fusibacter tunisiensis]
MMELRCITCQKTYRPEPGVYTCETCGPLFGTLEVVYDYESISVNQAMYSKTGTLFQFKELLPVKGHTPIDSAVGGTPLLTFSNVLGLEKLQIKFDGVSLSGSYKDRASIIAIHMALEQNANTIYCASTGNAASSLAILSAHTRLKTVIFVPASAPKGKLAQLIAAGAQVHLIEDTYDTAFDISMKVGFKKGWYCRNSAINPYLTEGKKTGAFEILIQNDYKVPDYVFVSVGDGTVISGLIKGFEEFMKLGLVDRTPKVIGVQAAGAAAIKTVYEKGAPFKPQVLPARTLADSISVGNPRDVIKACTYMARNGGAFIAVTDSEIQDSILEMTTTTGVFAEPAGAVPFAGLKKMLASGEIRNGHSVVLVVTGNGLKDPSHLKVTLPKALSPEEALKI